ncbi:MAG: NAD(P)(+) transhydrogenase (Re/Si-specific) subunit beta [Alphaproteobacteria bacterium]|nr:NAD(P)(+) transhydrogenase (Re/Si-specific) subunit beta [Alphaproteobacteria bacterium]MDD9920235.1 NAD(P)(+) transhydrogenase (Re/Si-specific) subunit beta [Alphaproteobacteria bacterium]
MVSADFFALAYLGAAVLFILGIKGLSHPKTANRGNTLAMLGMALAIGITLLDGRISEYLWIFAAMALGAFIGIPLANKVKTTQLPQMVALFNGLVGLAAAAVAGGEFLRSETLNALTVTGQTEIALSALIGTLTFSGSVIAAGKLHGWVTSKPVTMPLGHWSTLVVLLATLGVAACFSVYGGEATLLVMIGLTFLLGLMLVLPIGGADMPVVVALFNAYSGWAGVATGFMLSNIVLVVGGSLVGASGLILTFIMCQAMNRSFLNVILGGFGAGDGEEVAGADLGDKTIQQAGVEDAAFMMGNARKVVLIPGYGMAVAQAQHALREVMDVLESQGLEVSFAIHPVAGRMPGHMNVLLAEADVPYENVVEMDTINPQFPQTDVVLVIGANDVVNPDAKNVQSSPLYGMPILEAYKAKTVYVVKRSMRSGYSGVENALFYQDNTYMIFGDAKDVCEKLSGALKDA